MEQWLENQGNTTDGADLENAVSGSDNKSSGSLKSGAEIIGTGFEDEDEDEDELVSNVRRGKKKAKLRHWWG